VTFSPVNYSIALLLLANFGCGNGENTAKKSAEGGESNPTLEPSTIKESDYTAASAGNEQIDFTFNKGAPLKLGKQPPMPDRVTVASWSLGASARIDAFKSKDGSRSNLEHATFELKNGSQDYSGKHSVQLVNKAQNTTGLRYYRLVVAVNLNKDSIEAECKARFSVGITDESCRKFLNEVAKSIALYPEKCQPGTGARNYCGLKLLTRPMFQDQPEFGFEMSDTLDPQISNFKYEINQSGQHVFTATSQIRDMPSFHTQSRSFDSRELYRLSKGNSTLRQKYQLVYLNLGTLKAEPLMLLSTSVEAGTANLKGTMMLGR
jgi:hypothetical protein